MPLDNFPGHAALPLQTISAPPFSVHAVLYMLLHSAHLNLQEGPGMLWNAVPFHKAKGHNGAQPTAGDRLCAELAHEVGFPKCCKRLTWGRPLPSTLEVSVRQDLAF